MWYVTRRQTGFKAKALGGRSIQPGAFAMDSDCKLLSNPKAVKRRAEANISSCHF
jgi:hypothetical protein